MAFEDGGEKVVEALYALRDMVIQVKSDVDNVQNFLEDGSSSMHGLGYNSAKDRLDKILSELKVEEQEE